MRNTPPFFYNNTNLHLLREITVGITVMINEVKVIRGIVKQEEETILLLH